MYSFKKILNILIGIAAAGVATADDTSSDASSVSLSLSLTNTVPSNKAGKQPKAGKQVKAAVLGNAVKAKALKDYNSLSYSYSMSYGPDVDTDSAAAGLTFKVQNTRFFLRRQYSNLAIRTGAAITLVAIGEAFAAYTIALASEEAAAKGSQTITLDDVNKAIGKDGDLAWMHSQIDLAQISPFYDYQSDVERLRASQYPNISFLSEAQDAIHQFVSGVFILTANQVNSDATENVLVVYDDIVAGFKTVMTRFNSPPNGNTAEAGTLALDKALQAYNAWTDVID